MENTVQEVQVQPSAPEHIVDVPTEECRVCASGFDPNVGGNLFQEALSE